jgi:hypothetical protein
VVRNADLGILHSLYNQAPKKVILYEKQYKWNFAIACRANSVRNRDANPSRMRFGNWAAEVSDRLYADFHQMQISIAYAASLEDIQSRSADA